MTVYNKTIKVKSELYKPVFHDVTKDALQAVTDSGVKNGLLTIYSQHTTCSVIIQEESHDETFDGTKFIMQDLLDIFNNIAPRCRKEGQYLHPGPDHIDHATKNLNEEAVWSLNTDGHLRSVIMGRSECIPIVDGEAQMGEFGEIYFVDFDSVRLRERTVRFQVMGE